MQKTKIEYCNYTWSPVTGCYHGCEYCYAKRIAHRFSGFEPSENPFTTKFYPDLNIAEVNSLQCRQRKDGKMVPAAFPYGFIPTFHRYKLDEPELEKKPQIIFVCSMGDLFGDFIPDEWIAEVFNSCDKAPWHTYLFLTKNPSRYLKLAEDGKLPEKANFWYGSTMDTTSRPIYYAQQFNTFISMEPILQPFVGKTEAAELAKIQDWIVMGAETGNRKGKVVPEKSWVSDVVEAFQDAGKPVFMKNSMKPIWGDEILTQTPWNRG